MLQGIHNLSKGWVGRVLVTVLFGLLIVAFAIWGIGDIFRGQVRTQVATVGGSDIPAEIYRTAYQTEYQNLIRRTRQSITPDQARALGLDTRVLGRLVTDAVLDRRARELGIAISDSQVISAIQTDPSFQDATGRFQPSQFAEAIRSAGYTEAQYVRDQRGLLARLQIGEATTGSLSVPLALREAVHRFQNEKRVLEYLTVDAVSLEAVPPPSESDLQAYFDARKGQYRAPEYRTANTLALDPASLAKPESVSAEDARSFYDRVKDTRFGTPERRRVQQIVFPNATEAAAAAERIKAGTTFEALAAEQKIDDATLNLGTVAKGDLIDPAVADAAFGLPSGAASGPVEGRFGTVLVRVTDIEPGSLKPFDDVADEVRREVATARARDQVQTVHDAIEDQRASARALSDIARERGLLLARIETDRSGQTPSGQPASQMPDVGALVQAMFRADVGTDNEAVRTRDGGYVWFDVTNVAPARDRPLADVRERVLADWRTEEVSRRLSEKARGIVSRVVAGEPIETVAQGAGLKVERSGELTRGSVAGDLTRGVVTRAFATPVGKAADAASADDKRVVFRVVSATMPPFVTSTQEAAGLEEQLRNALAQDMQTEYVADAQRQIGVTTFPENMRRAIGGES